MFTKNDFEKIQSSESKKQNLESLQKRNQIVQIIEK